MKVYHALITLRLSKHCVHRSAIPEMVKLKVMILGRLLLNCPPVVKKTKQYSLIYAKLLIIKYHQWPKINVFA